jgi:hypothetical protein
MKSLLAFYKFSPYIRRKRAPEEKRSVRLWQKGHGMHTNTTIQPGRRGAKQFVEQYGDRLVCVRYRSDEQRRKRFKTIELIVDEWSWEPPAPQRTKDSIVSVKVAFSEKALRQQIKEAGGVWNPDRQVWELRHDRAVALGLKDRIWGGPCS